MVTCGINGGAAASVSTSHSWTCARLIRAWYTMFSQEPRRTSGRVVSWTLNTNGVATLFHAILIFI